ncbi:hypothetical protein S14_203 [Shewanella sp. phage 1/4]|uniref:hypothetical protein n=1 Tax=Shewanella phage 1/4 TaxID=1458859 RepID=UPI0004F904F8|nr:hypothetical protein S14_203 [Shewanella sp. phage 1/4]AHK11312.1 hypothetical protein S14_203 [Shewanella sp. phage 1/4]
MTLSKEDLEYGFTEQDVEELQSLTIEDVKQWDFKGQTPAQRGWYYNENIDVCAYISGGSSLTIYYGRKDNHGNSASSFNKCLELRGGERK